MALLEIERLRSLKAAGQYQDAYNLYLQLVAMRQTSAEACLIGGQAAKKLGNLWAAKDALESCIEREPEGAVLGTARFVLGEVLRLVGKVHESMQYLTAFIDGLPHYPELQAIGLGPAHFNRGTAFWQAGRLEESLQDFSIACSEFRREGLSTYLCMGLHNLAWVGALFGDSVQAREALEEAKPLCTTPALKWHQRVGEAFLSAIAGDPLDAESMRACKRRALELCEVVYNHQGDDLPAEVRSQGYWLAGTISLELGDVEGGLHFGQQAMQWALATPIPDTRSLYDAADLLRQVYAVRPQFNRTGP